SHADHRDLHSFPTRRSSDLIRRRKKRMMGTMDGGGRPQAARRPPAWRVVLLPGLATRTDLREREDVVGVRAEDRVAVVVLRRVRSEEHTSELQSRGHLVCRL